MHFHVCLKSSNQSFISDLPNLNAICESWKHQTLEQMGFEFHAYNCCLFLQPANAQATQNGLAPNIVFGFVTH